MVNYLIDTCTISDYVSKNLPENGLKFLDGVIGSIPNLSVVTKIELLSWKTDNSSEEKIKELINDSNVYELSDDVVDGCVQLRRAYKFKTPDAIIAATALACGYELITSNTKDFSNIRGLKITDPRVM